jgi:hypothetical protein
MEKGKIYDGRLPKIFRMVISGSSSTGKSHFIGELLENQNGILHEDMDKIIYLRGVETEKEQRLKKEFGSRIIFYDGIPPEEILLKECEAKGNENHVLVIEDLDDEVSKSAVISKFFTAYSHHLKCSVIYTTQNFFKNGPERLSVMRNCTHLILFNINLDETVIRFIAQKIYPKNPKSLIELYEKVTGKEYQHLAIYTQCPKELKFRSETTKSVQKIYQL